MTSQHIEPLTTEIIERWPLTRQAPSGKGSKLNQATAAAVCETIAAGNYIATACQAADIGQRTYQTWMQKAAADPDSVYAEFADLVARAEAIAEAANVIVIRNAAETTWTAAAWLLERKYPERWGRRDRTFSTVQGEHKVTFVFEDRKPGARELSDANS